MTREEADFIGGMNMCDEISNEAYRKIMCHCEEQEPCEDCISRQAVIELCEGWWLGHTKEDDFATEVRALPSVNPQKSKTGHWIEPKDFMWENPKCSECGFESADHDNYCPHCGIRMVEPQESEVKQ